MGSVRYESDFVDWTFEQARLLRAGDWSALDVERIAEELEAMGRSERRALVHRLEVLLMHLLKWQFQPGRRSPSWRSTIRIQRIEVAELLADNPSLKPQLDAFLAQAYRKARLLAAGETGLDEGGFPQTSPYTAAEVIDEAWWPGAP
ncbi:MAG TPA: DUF29 domain-containing protein [Plasticicumulans sp.]|nr:DUF29 domain-containing protein [Pseudomonadota bacterium]RTL00229.1 MAG: DUF29 domain-containing protein [Xanthomonadales bacterium]HMV38960.1 DUF29 domain-containing protein [Plasticicumulans sp.]HMW28624.1 DUF29 domain-containing protein [Plasticicumulans sp.]HMZ09652.1 DUF29 domain-containing protein [Plasticicumulans sp.]